MIVGPVGAVSKKLKTANTILYCKEWEKTVRFYRDRLHLTVIFSTDWFVEFSLTEHSRLSIADEKHSP
jgi:catechol 2,3-dioxygenase-like lactoylglutathione lyase family enzyme